MPPDLELDLDNEIADWIEFENECEDENRFFGEVDRLRLSDFDLFDTYL